MAEGDKQYCLWTRICPEDRWSKIQYFDLSEAPALLYLHRHMEIKITDGDRVVDRSEVDPKPRRRWPYY